MGRYDRNIGTITIEDQAVLACKSVCVVGCGGLGGGVIENLTRMGVGEITVVDGDVFDESNLNRQVLSNEENLGKSKAEEAAEQMSRINSEITFVAITDLLNADNAEVIIDGSDVVVDALDNPETRLILEKACENLNIPLVHGAISGWNGQVGICMPGSRMISQLYGEGGGADESPTNPSFTPAVISALQAAEAIKLMLCMEEALINKLLVIDLLDHEYEVIDFGG
ncbi:MAG: HesA/MoeB/ThiF family protein [Firmicutes bacterium]|nr:HesA/MoeB/ThiF family protein [Bacillota bacterium]